MSGPAALVPAAPSNAMRARAARIDVSVRVVIRDGRRTKRAHFISRSTDGVLARVYAHDDPQHLHLLGRSATDVSSGSAACGGQTGYPRSCTVSVPAPAGDDDFAFTTYDAPPNNGQFPSTAHVLGLGALTQRIVADRNNGLAIYIGGVIASIGGAPAFASLAGDGKYQRFGFVLQPEDFNDDPIVAGKRDPYANPIALSLAETGSTGHASLSLNGRPGTSTIVSDHSDDRLALDYDGKGAPGYGIVVTISAKGVKPQKVQLSPLFVSSSSPFFVGNEVEFYGVGQMATLNLSELNAPSSTRYKATLSGVDCSVRARPVKGSGASASVVVTSGEATTSQCRLTISDGSASVTIAATDTISVGRVTVPNVTISEFPIPTASAKVSHLVAGSDGAIWFAECNAAAGKIGRIPTNATPGSGAQIGEYPVPTAAAGPYAIVAAADGALWFTERGNDAVGRIPTDATPGSGAQIDEYPAGSPFSTPSALLAGPSGALWFTDLLEDDAGVMNLGGGVAQTVTLTAPGSAMAQDAVGNVWIATPTSHSFVEIAPNGGMTTFPLPTSSQIVTMTFDASGNLWMADAGLNAIDELPSGAASIVQFPVPQGGRPIGLTIGPDGALWFTDNLRNAIGRMTTAGVFAPLAGYAIPTAQSVPLQIVNGPDGALWFVEFDGNNIGRVVPSAPASARRHAGTSPV